MNIRDYLAMTEAARRAWREAARIGARAVTPGRGYPFPLRSWPPDAAIDIEALAEAVDADVTAGLAKALPAGAITVWAGATAPTGWLLCQGQAVSRTTYADLFAVCGIVYGIGDGSTTFNVPDLRKRHAVGVDATSTPVNTVGKKGGSQALHAAVNVAGNILAITRAGAAWTAANQVTLTNSLAGGSAQTNAAQVVGDTDPASSLPPYIALHHIIKT